MKKFCTKCGVGYPPTTEYFYRQTSVGDSLRSACKMCARCYNQSTAGKTAKKRYGQSEKGKAANKRHKQSEKCKDYQRGYWQKYCYTTKGYLRRIFFGMIQRCTDPKSYSYKWYGGRGIKVCFKSADEFVNYVMGELQIDPRGLTIDRIDNDGNYERGNIRFVTQAENNKNKSGAL